MSTDDSELQQAILASLDVSKPKRAAAKKAGRKAAGKKAGRAPGKKAPSPALPTEEVLARRQLMAEQDLAYQKALEQDQLAEEQHRMAEEQARLALQEAELARRLAVDKAQRAREALQQHWLPVEAEHGTADRALATHHLRIVGRFGQMRVAFLPTAPISALCALIQYQFNLTDFALPAVDDAGLPISALPNWSVVRVVEQ